MVKYFGTIVQGISSVGQGLYRLPSSIGKGVKDSSLGKGWSAGSDIQDYMTESIKQKLKSGISIVGFEGMEEGGVEKILDGYDLDGIGRILAHVTIYFRHPGRHIQNTIDDMFFNLDRHRYTKDNNSTGILN